MNIDTHESHNLCCHGERAVENSTKYYPRVLVVNAYPFCQGFATGLTLNSLFRGWPKDRLACLYTVLHARPDWTLCERYWRLSFRYMHCITRWLGNPLFPEMAKPPITQDNKAEYCKSRYFRERIVSVARRIKNCVPRQGIRDLSVYDIPNEVLTQQIDRFNPQVIYSMLASNPLLHLCIDIAEHCSIPIVPHFMDDWPTTLYRYSILRTSMRKIMQQRLNAILGHSPKRLTIGDAMAKEYTRRYGGEFTSFMNSVEPELLKPSTTTQNNHQITRLIYVGGLHLNRWRSLCDIAKALKQLTDEGLQVEALIYTPPRFAGEAKKINLPPIMRLAGSLTISEVPKTLRNADIVLHVESFDRLNRIFTKYSVSTKIPECMAAGRPIFAYGPEELASIRYVQESGSGLAVGSQNHADLVTTLRRLVTSQELRESLGKQGRCVAASRHNASVERERFRSVLEAVAVGNQPCVESCAHVPCKGISKANGIDDHIK